MINFTSLAGTPTRVTTSGATVLTSGPCVIHGLYVAAVLTGQIVQFWTQNATSITGTPVIGTCTMVANTYFDLRMDLPLGLTYCVTNEDIDLTIFWRPARS